MSYPPSSLLPSPHSLLRNDGGPRWQIFATEWRMIRRNCPRFQHGFTLRLYPTCTCVLFFHTYHWTLRDLRRGPAGKAIRQAGKPVQSVFRQRGYSCILPSRPRASGAWIRGKPTLPTLALERRIERLGRVRPREAGAEVPSAHTTQNHARLFSPTVVTLSRRRPLRKPRTCVIVHSMSLANKSKHRGLFHPIEQTPAPPPYRFGSLHAIRPHFIS